ncbi:MAG TPA: reverse transcriptase domain-containing protein, partial [Candidatus Babeliaceae bacterium]|nr:reverse transcriptase domain-containing protein [Candidatus Babeliaceae bacterium]
MPLVDTAQADKPNMLRILHPSPSPQDNILPTLPHDSPLVTVRGDTDLVKLINKMVNGSAPGPSGWTIEMVHTLVQDPDCLSGLALLIQDITNGTLPDSIKPFLLSSKLIGLDKNAGTSIRPIAIGEIFYRIAAYRAQQNIRDQACEILQPIQLGVGTPNGCESIIRNLQHALELPHHPIAALAIDFKNAFNSISRKAMLKALCAQPTLESLWRLVNFAYSSPSDLLIRDHNHNLYAGLSSTQGVRQGDPLSSLLFTLTIQPVYQATIQQHP